MFHIIRKDIPVNIPNVYFAEYFEISCKILICLMDAAMFVACFEDLVTPMWIECVYYEASLKAMLSYLPKLY